MEAQSKLVAKLCFSRSSSFSGGWPKMSAVVVARVKRKKSGCKSTTVPGLGEDRLATRFSRGPANPLRS